MRNKELDSDLLNEITNKLVSEFQPEEIILFGSYIWGRPHEDSDLDLLVVISESQERPTMRATRAYRCLRGIRMPIDILVKTRREVERHRPVYASLTRRILDEGKILYGRPENRVGT